MTTAIGIPIAAAINTPALSFLVIMAVLSVKPRVTSSTVHRVASSLLEPHNGYLNPFEIVGDITEISKDEYKKSIVMIAPHGPTFYPSVYYGSLFEREFDVPYTVLATPALFTIPYAPMIMSSLCNIVCIDPISLTNFLEGHNGPGVTYPGGFDDVFDNSTDNSVITVNVNPKSLLFALAAKNGRCLLPTLVLNETSIFTHAKFVVDFFKYVHKNYARTGIPVPGISSCGLPMLASTKKMILMYGPPVSDNDPDVLADKYIDAVVKLHDQAIAQGKTTKPLRMKVRGPRVCDIVAKL